jgi:hypothetical protein
MSVSTLKSSVGALIGVAFFLLMFDPSILDPRNIDWLLANEDSRMSFIGWHFFHGEPWLFPPGAARRYGIEMSSAIVYSDAVPLFALVGKLVSSLVDGRFQYMGLWVLTCYVAQGIFAWALAGRVVNGVLPRVVMVMFVVASPILLHRSLGHHGLMGHWLVVAALYVALRPFDTGWNRRWSALLCVAALVHAYIACMVVAIWLADIVRRTGIDRALPTRKAAGAVLWTSTAVAATMWMAGYFTLPLRDFASDGPLYGRFAAPLNAFWVPLWLPTRFVDPQPLTAGAEIEGAHYIGVGIMMLCLLAAWLLARRRPSWLLLRPFLPLIVVTLGLWMFAVSHQVRWGEQLLVSLPFPAEGERILASLRSSGRFLWVPYYALIAAVVGVTAARLPPRLASAALVGALVLQLVDLAPWYAALRRESRHYATAEANRMRPLESPIWPVVGRHYRSIRFVPAANKPPEYDRLALFAADHDLAINVGFFARVSSARLHQANAALASAVATGHLDRDSLYVFWRGDPPVAVLSQDDGVGIVDGYHVVAPGWFRFADCCNEAEFVLRPP